MNTTKFPYWKLIFVWIVFLGLHFSYETFPNLIFQIIGEEGETNYFHMKMLFFAYLFGCIVEFFINRKKIGSLQQFSTSRALVSITYPWLTITFFFLAQAFTGGMLEMPWEIIWANIATVIGIYFALRLEQAFDEVEFRPALRWMIWLIFLSALFTYIVFTFDTPEHFFETPEGFGHGH